MAFFRSLGSSQGSTLVPVATMHPMQEELVKTLLKARDEARSASARTKEIDGHLQSVADEAEHTIALVPFIKPANAEGLMGIWSSTAVQASRINDALEPLNNDTRGTLSSASVSTVIISGAYLHNGLHVNAAGFDDVWGRYTEFARRPAIRTEVAGLLRKHGFDRPQFPGDKSPLEQFEIAHNAFESPVTKTNPVSTSLIPLRECIQSVVDAALARRPIQEPAKSQRDKILSIGRQLGWDGLPLEVIDELAAEWDDLNSEVLHQSKRRATGRSAWLGQLNRGTSFLRSLLEGIDPEKHRR